MAAYWSDDDPIFDPFELAEPFEEECERCGSTDGPMAMVADCDPSVGYASEIAVCAKCLQRIKRR
jgi:hypothetical protein